MINKCVIERKSFYGAPCGRSEPAGEAEMVEGGAEGGMEGGVTPRATALLLMNYSRVFLLTSVKDERKV